MIEYYEHGFNIDNNPNYIYFMLGLLIPFAVIFILSIKGHNLESYWFVLGPALCILFCSLLPEAAIRFIHRYILIAFDFPVAYVETCLFIQLINYLSRIIRNKYYNDEQRIYKTILCFISLPALVISFTILFGGLHPENIKFLHGITFGGVVFCFIYSIVADNGNLIDTSLLALKIVLIVAPTLSTATGIITQILRIILVIISISSYNFKYDEPDFDLKVLNAFKKDLNEECAPNICKSFTCLFITYILISPSGFINPKPPVSTLYALAHPAVFIFYLLNEALYYHVYKTPKSQNS
ncbi:hypothetical protein TVAG_170390 [Trichomonas vaginalis G3]|uniref:Uncharacterized protein n=1 Tax=Trichomonas vaginalis (strain ATCC PRA-98 / G3) TaxID=412133 RepID=A2DPI1_TRIV3|nr:hypothetical protein TVAGG3_0680470 [Trichomonas vaginalis G3]EAY17725.1 hypothetical protein TVAG_170390 [Trichomonas vaginalis G3]KAI5507871.1 hypothetical protein TVAGG3_0680470 [Trichomonas vaginalis G3]|eukprot:XP_001329860.1 hypothetical protein [Trichomonas vaginalis G3]